MKFIPQAMIIIGIIIIVFPMVILAEDSTSTTNSVDSSDSEYEVSHQFNPMALDAGEIAPLDGILIDERTSAELVLLTASDLRLRTELEVRQNLWGEQEAIYEGALTSLQGQVETLMTALAGQEPSWWDHYGGVVLGTIGFVVGAVVTILVAWAVAEAVSPNVVAAE